MLISRIKEICKLAFTSYSYEKLTNCTKYLISSIGTVIGNLRARWPSSDTSNHSRYPIVLYGLLNVVDNLFRWKNPFKLVLPLLRESGQICHPIHGLLKHLPSSGCYAVYNKKTYVFNGEVENLSHECW